MNDLDQLIQLLSAIRKSSMYYGMPEATDYVYTNKKGTVVRRTCLNPKRLAPHFLAHKDDSIEFIEGLEYFGKDHDCSTGEATRIDAVIELLKRVHSISEEDWKEDE